MLLRNGRFSQHPYARRARAMRSRRWGERIAEIALPSRKPSSDELTDLPKKRTAVRRVLGVHTLRTWLGLSLFQDYAALCTTCHTPD